MQFELENFHLQMEKSERNITIFPFSNKKRRYSGFDSVTIYTIQTTILLRRIFFVLIEYNMETILWGIYYINSVTSWTERHKSTLNSLPTMLIVKGNEIFSRSLPSNLPYQGIRAAKN